MRDEHERIRAANVRPADWRNPRPAGRYNLVVVGGGTAGLVTAAAAAILGARVALVERDRLGGDCLNTGCVPSKALLHESRRAALRGVPDDSGAVMRRVRERRAEISHHDSARRFADLGVDVYFGHARFTGTERLEVDGTALTFRRAVIATGGRPFVPPVEGLAGSGFLTSETVFEIDRLPRELVVLGGGPIGCELAQAFQRLGSRVTLVEMLPRLLPREDGDAAALVEQALRDDGVAVRTAARAVAVRSEDDRRIVEIERLGSVESIGSDGLVVAVGRRPNVQDLGLEAAGVAFDPVGGVEVDDRLRTSSRRIYAAGDVASSLQFTHLADAAARIVVRNALFFGRKRFSALHVPWCTYTDPEVAHVGLDATAAAARGIETEALTVGLGEVDRAILERRTEGFLRVWIRRGTDRLVGATVVAEHAGETIGELALAISASVGLAKISDVIHPYPTVAEAVRKVADLHRRRRLSPRARRLLSAWFRALR